MHFNILKALTSPTGKIPILSSFFKFKTIGCLFKYFGNLMY